jgi:perosamine synthetase
LIQFAQNFSVNIPFFNTHIEPGAQEQVASVLQSTFLSEGTVVRDFEDRLADQLGLTNCVALNSGTSALHLALVLAGIGPGDEVILPAQTFVATGLVIIQQGATPVFCDIDYQTGNMLVGSFREKVTARTKAVIPVHWGGYPCDMDEINAIARENNIVVVEDAAHALGAIYKDKLIGGLSDYTCFSFQAIKHLTTGDGGALCILSNDKYKEAITRRWFGIDRENAAVSELGERQYSIEKLGFKYHLNNYAAALGIANLNGFDRRMKSRREVAAFYHRSLENVAGIELFKYRGDRQSAYWLFGFHVEKRLEFIRSLKAKGVATSVAHQRIDRNRIFGSKRADLFNQERFDATQIHIPIHDAIDMEKAGYIVDAIRAGW